MGTFLYGANVSANTIRQHYLRYGGSGQPLVVIPGITSPAITWGFVAERLAERHDVYVVDARGRGLSSSGPGLDYSLSTMAQDLVAFTAAMNLKDAIILGHSMGARIAVRAHTIAQDFARGLLLVDPPVSGPGRRPYPSALSWYVDSIRLAQKGMSAEDMGVFCPTWTLDQLQLRAEWLATCYEPAIIASFEGFHNDDIHSDLARVRIPTHLMIAGRGDVIRPEDEDEIIRLNPGIDIVHVRTAGHMIPWDDLNGFLSAFHAIMEGAAVHV